MYIVHEKMAGNFNMQLHSLCKTFKMVSRWVLKQELIGKNSVCPRPSLSHPCPVPDFDRKIVIVPSCVPSWILVGCLGLSRPVSRF